MEKTMEKTIRLDYYRGVEFAGKIDSPRTIALYGGVDRSGEFQSKDWFLESVGRHTFGAHWTVRAKTRDGRRHLAALALGYESWEEVPAEVADAAAKCRYYVPALKYLPGALTCARLGLRGVSRDTINHVVGHHVRLNHPHEGLPYIVLDVWVP